MSHQSIHLDDKAFTLLVPAFLGSVVAVTREKNIRPRDAVVRIFTGTVTSFFVTPLVTDLLNISEHDTRWYPALGFLIGMTGYALIPTLTRIVINTAKTYLKDK